MIIAFRHLAHDNTVLDTIDSLFTNSNYVHVQIIFSNCQVGGAWIKKGVQFRSISNTITYPFLWDFVEVNDLNEAKVYQHIQSKLGEKFSILGSFGMRLFPVRKKNMWYCSDIVFSSLLAGGLKTKLSYLNSIAISPQKIYDILIKENNYKLVRYNDCCI